MKSTRLEVIESINTSADFQTHSYKRTLQNYTLICFRFRKLNITIIILQYQYIMTLQYTMTLQYQYIMTLQYQYIIAFQYTMTLQFIIALQYQFSAFARRFVFILEGKFIHVHLYYTLH